MKVKHGLKCPKCEERIFSMYRHDFKACKCGSIFVDGGDDYFRFGTLKAGVDIDELEEITWDNKLDNQGGE
jgi:hypothetical protein